MLHFKTITVQIFTTIKFDVGGFEQRFPFRKILKQSIGHSEQT